MLVQQIAAVRNSVVFVLRIIPTAGGAMQILPVGTAAYVGSDIFLTANHLFEDPPVAAGEVIQLGWLPNNGHAAVIFQAHATIDFASPAHDLVLLRAGGFGTTLSALPFSVAGEPDGRSVFCYGFITPRIDFTPAGPVLTASARAMVSGSCCRSSSMVAMYRPRAISIPVRRAS